MRLQACWLGGRSFGGLSFFPDGIWKPDQVGCQRSLPRDLQGSQQMTARHADGGDGQASLQIPREAALAADFITASTSLVCPWYSASPIPFWILQYLRVS